MKYILNKGGKYISDDYLIINLEKKYIYPISPNCFNFGRNENKDLKKSLNISKMIINPVPIDKLFLFENIYKSNSSDKTSRNIFDYLFLSSFLFINNPFLRSFIIKENLIKYVLKKLKGLKKIDIKYEFKKINNFNFDHEKL